MFRRNWMMFEGDKGGGGGGDNPPATPPATPPASDDKTPPGPVPYERFKEVNDALRQLQEWKAQQEKAEKERKEKELTEQQKWQQLAEQRDAELKAERLNRQRLEVATKKGLPVELAARLQGDSLEALEADADRLVPLLKPHTPGVPPGGKGNQPSVMDLSKMTPAQIREKEAELLEAVRKGQ